MLLDQFPDAEEDLRMQVDLIGTKGGADHVKERKHKALHGLL